MKLPVRKRENPAKVDPDPDPDPERVVRRRKALKAIGKFGIYTAPTLIALLNSGRAHAS